MTATRQKAAAEAKLREAQAEAARASAVKDLATAANTGQISEIDRLKGLNAILDKDSGASKEQRDAALTEMAKSLNLPVDIVKKPGFFENLQKGVLGLLLQGPISGIAKGITSVFGGGQQAAAPGGPEVAGQLVTAAGRARGGAQPQPGFTPITPAAPLQASRDQLEQAKVELRKLNIPDTDANALKLVSNNPDVFGVR